MLARDTVTLKVSNRFTHSVSLWPQVFKAAGDFMKQITLNSKLNLSTLLTAGAANCSATKGKLIVLGPSFRKWLSCVAQATLIGTLAISGCTSKDSVENLSRKSKQIPQETVSATTKPVHKEVGEASWYGPGFQGKETANGETFDQKDMTAAHPTLPMGTKAKVTNLETGKKVEVRINDRGPYADNRVIDLSSAAANKLDMKEDGTTQVKIETKPITRKKSAARHSSKTKLKAKKLHTRRH